MRHKTLPLGSIAPNLTSRTQTLVLCLSLLSDLAPSLAATYRAKPIVSKVESGADLNGKETTALITMIGRLLIDLNRFAPPYAYVGHLPGNQFHFGVWVDLGALHRAEESGQLVQASILTRGLKAIWVLDMTGAGLTLYRRRGKVKVWELA